MKRILSLALCIFLLLGYSSIALGKTDTNEKKIEKNLLKLGYTTEQINLLSETVKPELAQQADLGAKLVSFKHTVMKETKDVQGDVGIDGQISTSDLYLNLSVLDYGSVNNWNSRRIYSDFNWINTPYWKLVDKIGIAWADGWNITNNSDMLVYYYRGENTNTLYSIYYYDGQYTAEAGVDFKKSI